MVNILIEQQSINITMSQITNEIYRENGSSVNIENVQMISNGNVGITLEPCDPVDLQFKDITYMVNLGFTKGKYTFSFIIIMYINIGASASASISHIRVNMPVNP